LPDLRRSTALTDPVAWNQILLAGALQARGMVSFKSFLSPGNISDIRAYIGSEATSLAASGPSP
jgi:hypothetical protein